MTFDAPLHGGSAPDGGVMRDGVHVFPVRVYYEYTDAGGIVYHADYLRFAERARTEMMRLFGTNHQDLMERTGLAFAVAHCEMTFHRPARLDDLLLVETHLTEVGGASMWLRQDIRRGADLLVGLRLRLAMMTAQGRAGRIPQDLRQTLRDHMTGRPDGGAPDPSDAPET
jgi:acyl-CoA thioester hydrolase